MARVRWRWAENYLSEALGSVQTLEVPEVGFSVGYVSNVGGKADWELSDQAEGRKEAVVPLFV